MGGFITILHRGEKPWWQYASETQYDDHEYADDDFQHFATRYSDFYYPNPSRNLVRVKEVFSVGPAENTCGCHGLLALQFPSSLKLMFVSTSEGRRYKQKIYEIYIIKDEKTSHWWEWSQWWQMLPDIKASCPIASDTTFVLQPSTVCNLYSLYFFCSLLHTLHGWGGTGFWLPARLLIRTWRPGPASEYNPAMPFHLSFSPFKKLTFSIWSRKAAALAWVAKRRLQQWEQEAGGQQVGNANCQIPSQCWATVMKMDGLLAIWGRAPKTLVLVKLERN